MGEALISRAGGGEGEVETPIPIIPGYHTILATIKLPNGDIAKGWPISCKDGSVYYNYNTNDLGQVLFSCNSGSANIYIGNVVNNVHYIDILDSWKNIPAQVGLSTRLNIELQDGETFSEFLESTLFAVYKNRLANNIILVGGGGGGGCITGHGGGSGYLNQYNNINLIGNNVYNFVVGTGGIGARNNLLDGNAGGTSYIVNTEFSAQGGQGGQTQDMSGYVSARGGLGNGGQYDRRVPPENSPVNFAGGGGGGAVNATNGSHVNTTKLTWGMGGSPYGGNGYASAGVASNQGSDGIRGGGGGGGVMLAIGGYNGGSGLMRINISYD